MGDIISKIILQAQGGDESAQEILKTKKALEEVQHAEEAVNASSISPTGAGNKVDTSALTSARENLRAQAEQQKFAEVIGRSVADATDRKQAERKPFEKARATEPPAAGKPSTQEHGPTSRTGTEAIQGARIVGNVTQQVASSDIIGATASGASGLGQLGMAAAPGSALAKFGMAGVVAGIALGAANGLIGREEDRVKSMWSSGMAQRMGVPYESLRNYSIDIARTGIPSEVSQSLLGSYSIGGGTLNKASSANLSRAMEMSTSLGIDPSSLGSFSALTNRLGINSKTTGDQMYGVAGKSFGVGQITSFINELERSTKSLLSLGVTLDNLTSKQISGFRDRLAGYSQFGGLSSEGATALNSMSLGRAEAAGRLQNGQDIIALSEVKASIWTSSPTETI